MVTYTEKFVRQDASIPGLTIDGKDIKSLLDSKGFESFLREDAYHISFDETALSNKVFSEQEKEAIISQFAGYSKDVKEYFNFNLAVIKKLISSINRMIPSDLHEDEIDAAERIKDSVQKMSYAFSLYDDCIQNKLLVLFEQEKETIGARSISAKIHHGFRLMKVMIDLNLLSMRIPLLHQIVYDYFYGPEEEKSEKADMIQIITEKVQNRLLLQLTPEINRINSRIEQMSKTTEQALTEKKTANESLKLIKKNQEEIKKLVKNRNEIDAEKTGTLSVEECVFIIGVIEKKYVELKQRDCISVGIPPETVKKKTEGTIRRNIEFWDQYQNGNKAKGRKPPRKDYSRNMDKETFGKWYNEIMLDKYNKWRAANRIDTLSGRPVKRFGDKYK